MSFVGRSSLLKAPRCALTYAAAWPYSRLFHAGSGRQELRRGMIRVAAHRAQTNLRERGCTPRPVPDVSLLLHSSLDAGTFPGLWHEFAKRRSESEICPKLPRRFQYLFRRHPSPFSPSLPVLPGPTRAPVDWDQRWRGRTPRNDSLLHEHSAHVPRPAKHFLVQVVLAFANTNARKTSGLRPCRGFA